MYMKEKKILLIRGAPGVGKSTLGNLIKKRNPGTAVIDVDVVRSMISKVNWDDRIMHTLSLSIAKDIAAVFSSTGLLPIIIDTLAVNRVKRLIEDFESDSFTCNIISLFAEDHILESRVASRKGYDKMKEILQLNKEIRKICLKNEYKMDTSYFTPENVYQNFMVVTALD